MFLGVIAVLTMTVSCSSKHDASIASHDSKAIVAIAQSEETRVGEAGDALSTSVNKIVGIEGATAGEKILGIALVGEKYADVLMSKLPEIVKNYKRATLGTDAQIAIGKEVAKGIPIVTLGAVAINSDRQDRGDKVIATDSEVNIKKEANHATSMGDSSPPTTSTREGVEYAPPEEVEVEDVEVVELEATL
jgi:hypothetical protein